MEDLNLLKCLQKNNKMAFNFFLLLLGGGQDKLAWTACPPGVKIIRVGGKISRDSLPPRGQANRGWLTPRGQAVQGADKMGHRVNNFSVILDCFLGFTTTK